MESLSRVDTVEQLGRLRETLRVSPHIAGLIRSFHFMWDLERGRHFEFCYERYEEAGVTVPLIELAFRDRSQMWHELACEVSIDGGSYRTIETSSSYEGSRPVYYFVHRSGMEIYDPGEPPLIEGCDPDEYASYDWSAP